MSTSWILVESECQLGVFINCYCNNLLTIFYFLCFAFRVCLIMVNILCSVSGESPGVSPKDHPINFTPVGDVICSGSHYIVPVRLDIDSLLDRITPLEVALTNTSLHFDSLRTLLGEDVSQDKHSSKPRHHTGKPGLRHFPASLRNHISLLIADLHQRVQNLQDVLTSLADFGLPEAPAMLR